MALYRILAMILQNSQMLPPGGSPGTSSISTLQARPFRRVEPLETVLVIVGLLWVMNTFGGILVENANRSGGSRESGSAILQIISLTVFGSGLVFLTRHAPRWFLGIVVRAWPLVALVLLAGLSTAWSDSPDTTLRRALALALSTSFAFYIVVNFSLSRALTLILLVLGIYYAVGIFASAIPGVGITPGGEYVGAWRGFTGIKNEFGRIIALGFALFVVLGLTGVPWWRRVWLAGVSVTLILLVLSKSKTALVAGLAGVMGAFLLRALFRSRWRRVSLGADVRAVIAVTVVLVLALLIGFFPLFAEALGRDATLSGRTKLWAWAISINGGKDWFGHGYRAFWIDANTKYFFEFFFWNGSPSGGKLTRSDSYAGPANGHSGYVDTWLELGIFGCALLATFFTSAFWRVWDCLRRDDMAAGYALATCLCFMIVYSITERVILQQSEGAWFLLILFYLFADPKRTRAAYVTDVAQAAMRLDEGR